MMTSRGKGRYSAHILKEALLEFFQEKRLFPKGMCREMECIQKWALRSGQAMQRLVSCGYMYLDFLGASGSLSTSQYFNEWASKKKEGFHLRGFG